MTDEMLPFEIQCKFPSGWMTICNAKDAPSAINSAMIMKQKVGGEYRVKECNHYRLLFSTEGLPMYREPDFDFDWLTEGF